MQDGLKTLDYWFLRNGKIIFSNKYHVHYRAVAFAGALNPKGKLDFNEKEMYTNVHVRLESYNLKATIPRSNFFLKKTPQKIYLYFASFKEKH